MDVTIRPRDLRLLGAICALACLCPAQQPQAGRDLYYERQNMKPGRRVALVIGNDKYTGFRPLQKARNDARDMSKVLSDTGFQVDTRLDANARDMEVSINRLIDQIQPDDTVLVYFAGHGVQIENENFLIPVDLNAKDEADVKYGAYSASKLHDKVQATGARLKIFVFDACRNNPFRTARSIGGGGLAHMDSGVGSYIAFAAAPGKVANESVNDNNGVFTKHLLAALNQPGLRLSEVFDRVRDAVHRDSNGNQTPWSTTSVIGDFYFRAPLPVVPTPAPAPIIKEVIREVPKEVIREVPKEVVVYRDVPKEVIREVPKEVIREVVREVPSNAGLIVAPGQVRRSMKDRQDYVFIPAGSFAMGCSEEDTYCAPDEKPVRTVTISNGFWMGVTEVEVKSYRSYLEEKNLKMPPGTDANPKWKYTDHPMTRMSAEEAAAYCEWAGGRLPTEAEWEYAARAGGKQAYTWGPKYDRARGNALGTTKEDKWSDTAPVKSFEPNAFGLYDMLGNVWEWTSDWYTEDGYGTTPASVTDPKGPESGIARVSRGGGWYGGPKELRVSARGKRQDISNEVGFRCVKTQWN